MRASAGWWLAAALVAGLPGSLGVARGGESRVVEIEARRFQFTPSEVRMKVGEAVTLRLRSRDVTHGFFMKALGIDATIEADKVTDVPVVARAPGRYMVICDHFCGAGHGNMHMDIVVE